MTDTMEILTIASEDRCYGISTTEIGKVIMDLGEAGARAGAIDRAKAGGRYYTLGGIFRYPEEIPDALLVIKADSNDVCVLGVNGFVDVMRIGMSQIIPVSDYIRKKQDPLFLWGIARTKDQLIILMTFSFLIEKGPS